MNRRILLTLAACVIIGLGLISAVILTSKTLAASTVEIRATSVQFEVFEKDRQIYVSARELKDWTNGWQSTILIGSVEEFDRSRVKILPEGDHVRLEVGKQGILFDGRTRVFTIQ